MWTVPKLQRTPTGRLSASQTDICSGKHLLLPSHSEDDTSNPTRQEEKALCFLL